VAAPTAFDKVASMGLAGVLAITVAEAIFWSAGMPLAEIWFKVTTGRINSAQGRFILSYSIFY
jgi:hypothetical protein